MPELAGSGSGSEGWQMLFRSPVRPLWPSVQNPSSEPMSPIPGTEQAPPGRGGLPCRPAVTAVTGRPASAWTAGGDRAADAAAPCGPHRAGLRGGRLRGTRNAEQGREHGEHQHGAARETARSALRISGALLAGGRG